MENAVDPETSSGGWLPRRRVGILGCFLLASLTLPVGAHAINYKALVTSSEGPLAGTFLELMTLKIEYTLDPTVPDTAVAPDHGVFEGAVLSLSVDIPGIRSSVVAGPAGRASTFDNTEQLISQDLSDEVLLASGPISSVSLPGGEQVTSLEVGFLSDVVVPPVEPGMIDGDGLPTSRLFYAEGFLVLVTSAGTTSVTFEPVDFIEDDGCAIGSKGHAASGFGWLVLLPALLLLARRRQTRCSE